LISGKTIFITPIDWGLGHATRCIPIIHELSAKNKIIIGVTKLNRKFFDLHFPAYQKVELPSYGIKYSKRIPLWLKLIIQWPKINAVIKKEKEVLKKIITDFKIDVVISDNRFGLTNNKIHSIFITHQLCIKAPLFSTLVNYKNKKYIHQFNEVWVPDHNDISLRLSGQLSDSEDIKIPVTYIGPKSALSILPFKEPLNQRFDYLILLSGVEPQRTILESILMKKFAASDKKIVLVRGGQTNFSSENKKIKIIDFAFGEDLRSLLVNAGTVICRSGYSTLMDLDFLRKKNLILIPTPGQSEQEYLAEYWVKQFGAKHISQKELFHTEI